MILSLIVWLAMQGQVQANIDACKADANCYVAHGWVEDANTSHTTNPHQPKYVIIDGCRVFFDDAGDTLYAPICDPKPKPAEHVIEIKTRTLNEPCWSSTDGPSAAVYSMNVPKCEHRRELWIDGRKFGVIKGLD